MDTWYDIIYRCRICGELFEESQKDSHAAFLHVVRWKEGQ